mmetsp:Transcript_115265/g.287930  ORF Transcript_115265/g.287930 Transcript_115265/m.287930 type:complete len:323 (-) Transcript_115265:1180-2148(-)
MHDDLIVRADVPALTTARVEQDRGLHPLRPTRHAEGAPDEFHLRAADHSHAKAAAFHAPARHRRRKLQPKWCRGRRPVGPAPQSVAQAERELVQVAVLQLADLALRHDGVRGGQIDHGEVVPLAAARAVPHLVLAQAHGNGLRRVTRPHEPSEERRVRANTHGHAQALKSQRSLPAGSPATRRHTPHLRAQLVPHQWQWTPHARVRKGGRPRLRHPTPNAELADLHGEVTDQEPGLVTTQCLDGLLRHRSPGADGDNGPLARLVADGSAACGGGPRGTAALTDLDGEGLCCNVGGDGGGIVDALLPMELQDRASAHGLAQFD